MTHYDATKQMAHPGLPDAERPLRIGSFRYFDIETTGLRPDRGAEITEIAVVDRSCVRIDWQRERDGQSVARQLPLLFDALGEGVVVGHNLPFDFRFVTYEAERHRVPGPTIHFIDTMHLARRTVDQTSDVQISTLLSYFDITPDGALHTALVDVRATRALFWALVEHSDLQTFADAGIRRLDWSTF